MLLYSSISAPTPRGIRKKVQGRKEPLVTQVASDGPATATSKWALEGPAASTCAGIALK